MRDLPNFVVSINGLTGEIFVSDQEHGRHMCVFVKNDTADFSSKYEAYGFMVWTSVFRAVAEYYPIVLQEDTLLTNDVMHEMWAQIVKQINALGR